jgi:uncharacterized membrane protein
MHRRRLLKAIDAERIRRAIAEAERRSTGEIRVSVATFFWGPVRRNAERAFARLGMARTRERNGVLFFIVPSRRRFVVLGDEGVHARLGKDFWKAVTKAVGAEFRKGNFTEGLTRGIEEVGRSLARHFPAGAEGNPNELPDELEADKRG